MIKTKLGLVINQINVIQGIATDKMNSQGAYRLHKLFKKLSEEQKELEEFRMKLIEEYAKKDKELKPLIEEGQYQFTEENIKAYTKKYEELLNTEVELEFKQIPFTLLDGSKMSIQDIDILESYFQFEEEVQGDL